MFKSNSLIDTTDMDCKIKIVENNLRILNKFLFTFI